MVKEGLTTNFTGFDKDGMFCVGVKYTKEVAIHSILAKQLMGISQLEAQRESIMARFPEIEKKIQDAKVEYEEVAKFFSKEDIQKAIDIVEKANNVTEINGSE